MENRGHVTRCQWRDLRRDILRREGTSLGANGDLRPDVLRREGTSLGANGDI